jgi:hypothetical protein
MVHQLLRALTFSNVCSFLALTVALATGTAYAAGTIGSGDIIDKSIRSVDIKNGQVTSKDIHNLTVKANDLGGDAVDGTKVADGTLTAADLGVGSVASGEIADDAVNGSKVAAGAISSDEIANGSITSLDLAGGRSNGTITLNAGFVADGRCRDFGVSVAGAVPGDAVLFGINSSVPHGIVFHGVRVSSSVVAVGKVCNFTGAAFPQLTDVEVAIVTLSLGS